MRSLLVIALGVLAILAPLDPAAAANTVTNEKSPGGLPYVRIHMPGAEKVAVRVAWPTDWATKEDANQAVPWVGARLMSTGGAEALPAAEAAERMSDIGAERDLWAETDMVKGWLSVKRENLGAAVEIMNAHLRAPAFPENWLDRARSELAAERTEGLAIPANMAKEALSWARLGDVALRRAYNGESPDRFESVQLSDVQSWHRSVFSTGPLWVVVAGDLEAEGAGKAVDALFAGLPAATAKAPISTIDDMRPRRILFHVPTAGTGRLLFVGEIPSISEGWKNEDTALIRELDRLMLEAARYELRAAYSTKWDNYDDSDRNRVFIIEGDVAADKLAEAEKLFRSVYASYRTNGPASAQSVRAEALQVLQEVAREPNGGSEIALFALETRRDPMLMVGSPEAFVQTITLDSMKARLAEAFPKPEDITIIAVSPNADSLPGACVITAPEQAVNCK
jgi:zinc protease